MTITEAEAPKNLTITLQNGQTLEVKSDNGKSLESLPVIDVSGMYSTNIEDRKAVAEQIRAAAHEIGFFYAINHVMITLIYGENGTHGFRVLIPNILKRHLNKQSASLTFPWRRKWRFTLD
jgi:hypothetical protein